MKKDCNDKLETVSFTCFLNDELKLIIDLNVHVNV